MPSQPSEPERRGGHAPAPEVRERPEQNIAYDEAVKGEPLSPEEREEAVTDSPLTDDAQSDQDTDEEWRIKPPTP